MTKPIDIALITKGHPFDKTAFFAMFDALPDIRWTHVEQPLAQALFEPSLARQFDAFVLYDMPGLEFRAEAPPGQPAPPLAFARHFEALVAEGFGFVFLHHAIAGWPAWDRYGQTIGGRFSYLPGPFAGVERRDSGYRHSVTHQLQVLADHPVTAGLPAQFEMTDELYLFDALEDEVTPLLSSRHAFTADNFYSAEHAVAQGRMFSNEGWAHPEGSNLVGWARTPGASRLVYLQGGDDPVAYASEHYRTLIGNAIAWVSDHKASDRKAV